MKRRINRRSGKLKDALLVYGTIFAATSLLTFLFLGVYLLLPRAISTVYGVPEEIVNDAIESNAATVMLLGGFDQKHSFAKGELTEFGGMPYDIEERLRNAPYYWTDQQVHRSGGRAGFSEWR